MPRHTHILNAASNLLGIAFVIIAGLNVTRLTGRTFADEVAWAAAVLLSLSCLLSYLAIRSEPNGARAESWADIAFMLGLLALFGSVLVLALTGL
jgi:multisubunit Na+/H+ antiporter MnhF subunit